MKVVDEFSHKGGKQFIKNNFPEELNEIYQVISKVNLNSYKIKVSREKTMPGKMLYSPIELNKAFKREFESLG